MDDIVRTVKSEPSCVLGAANFLHPNLQFTLEEISLEGILPFLDLNIYVSQDRCVTCNWCQKLTNTGTILKCRSCDPTQYKRSVIQGSVHIVFSSTINWEQFDKGSEGTSTSNWEQFDKTITKEVPQC